MVQEGHCDVAGDASQGEISRLQLLAGERQAKCGGWAAVVSAEAGGAPGAGVAAVAAAASDGAVHQEIVRAMRAVLEALVADGGAGAHPAGAAAVCDVALAPDSPAHVGLCAEGFLHPAQVLVSGLRNAIHVRFVP
jgi:hypothetical protein